MVRHLSIESLEKVTRCKDIGALKYDELKDLFLEEKEIAQFAPDGFCQQDPRNGDWIVYNSARARRPHDNHSLSAQKPEQKVCVICSGRTTQVLDVAGLSEGFTFINKNLYPILYPDGRVEKPGTQPHTTSGFGKDKDAHGFHFLQWTSSYHEKDWQNMPLADRMIVLQRLAVLEEKLLSAPDVYVSIIKNYGQLVGGSLVHGHQQIAASTIMPNRFYQDKKFKEEKGETFSAYMLRENPEDLVIRDYGPAALITPYFMRRPYDMLLVVKDTTKSYLHMLEQDEIAAVANGWQDAIRIMLSVMPRIGKETAYNVTTHNGPGAGLYFEFLPYTQEMGGFEHLGLYLCQGNPSGAAQTARELLGEYTE